jgi:hypothetical protein
LVDVAEQPRIVFESHSRCSDSRAAEELLREVLSRSRAPGHAWVVAMRIDGATPGVLHGEGAITNDAGAAVGRRVFTGKPGDCRGLASAVGIWASLALDAEMKRPRPVATLEGHDETSGTIPGATAAMSADTPADEPSPDAQPPVPPPGPPAAEPVVEAPPPADWPGASAAEKSAHREDGHVVEVGASGFLMTGSGGGLVMGASPFALVEVSKGVFLRPSIAVGGTLPGQEPVVTWATSRFDGCLRVAGLYTNLHGMQLDFCGGADLGVLVADHVFPYMAVGPSMDLRGELGGDLAVILRGLFGFNVFHEDSLDTPLLAGRGELALSWRLR